MRWAGKFRRHGCISWGIHGFDLGPGIETRTLSSKTPKAGPGVRNLVQAGIGMRGLEFRYLSCCWGAVLATSDRRSA